ncbi:MAG: CO dehydrogenase/acetyl-CoA synthase complex subunit epsilon [Deltaproteobacteria bacterium]|nr:MAG: CO dehydrogenase/acetyl-CoA synthase complex subunit epsilon [Deltaproteobacteria bacterium]
MATIPLHRVNVLTGIKGATILEDPGQFTKQIAKAKRPLLVLGPRLLEWSLDGKIVLEYALDIAKAANIPICATSHLKGKLTELGVTPDSVYDVVEIVNALKDPDWKGVKGEGNHDLVIFFGIRSDLQNQCLSVLKHFAFGHLKTMTLDKYYFPHADFSLNNIRKDKDWKAFLEDLTKSLQTKS